jgi:hypothetical protein
MDVDSETRVSDMVWRTVWRTIHQRFIMPLRALSPQAA